MELQKPQLPKIDPIVALQSKLSEMLREPEPDESMITLLKDKLRELQAERNPAAALAERLQLQNEILEKTTGEI